MNAAERLARAINARYGPAPLPLIHRMQTIAHWYTPRDGGPNQRL